MAAAGSQNSSLGVTEREAQDMNFMCARVGSNGSQRPGPGLVDSLQSHSSVVTGCK